MLLLSHVAIALFSIAATTYLLIRPTRTMLRITSALAAAVLTSGTWLTLSHPAHIAEACILGVLYTGGIGAAIFTTSKKLAHAPATYQSS